MSNIKVQLPTEESIEMIIEALEYSIDDLSYQWKDSYLLKMQVLLSCLKTINEYQLWETIYEGVLTESPI